MIDEWQLEPYVWDRVRKAVDDDATGGRFLLAGSAGMAPGVRIHSGAGRIVSFQMRPLAMSERRTHQDEVMDRLARSPHDSVVFAQYHLGDVQLAWELAHSLALDSDRTWSDLVKDYEKVDPIAVLPILNRLAPVNTSMDRRRR